MKLQYKVFFLGLVLFGFVNCEQEKTYTFEAVETEIQPYLNLGNEGFFEQSDTLIIYDTTFFKQAIATLTKYGNHLEINDSLNNTLIVNQLEKLQKEKIHTKNPSLFIPISFLSKFYEDEKLLETAKVKKLESWLLDLPIQFEAAKSQLEKPNQLETKSAVQALEKLYYFTMELEKKTKKDFERTELAIKDYLAFLQSKLNNGAVE